MFILHRLLSIAAVMGITAAMAVGQTNPPDTNPKAANWKKIGGQMILSGKLSRQTRE